MRPQAELAADAGRIRDRPGRRRPPGGREGGAGTAASISAGRHRGALDGRGGRRLSGGPVDGDHRHLPLPRPDPEILGPQVQDRLAPGVDHPHHDGREGDVDRRLEMDRRRDLSPRRRPGRPRLRKPLTRTRAAALLNIHLLECSHSHRMKADREPLPGFPPAPPPPAPCGRCSTPVSGRRVPSRRRRAPRPRPRAAEPRHRRRGGRRGMAGRSPSGSPRRCRPGWSLLGGKEFAAYRLVAGRA